MATRPSRPKCLCHEPCICANPLLASHFRALGRACARNWTMGVGLTRRVSRCAGRAGRRCCSGSFAWNCGNVPSVQQGADAADGGDRRAGVDAGSDLAGKGDGATRCSCLHTPARARACCWEASTFTLSPLRSPGDPADATRCSRGTKPIARSGDCPSSNEPSAGAASSPS